MTAGDSDALPHAVFAVVVVLVIAGLVLYAFEATRQRRRAERLRKQQMRQLEQIRWRQHRATEAVNRIFGEAHRQMERYGRPSCWTDW